MLKLRFASPERIVDINNIDGLDYIRQDPDGSLRIGALVVMRTWSTPTSSLRPSHARSGRLTCCRPARAHARHLCGLGVHADPQGDWAATMIALDGVSLLRAERRREIAMKDFVLGPFTNALAYNEVAVEAVIPPAKGTRKGSYLSSSAASATSRRHRSR